MKVGDLVRARHWHNGEVAILLSFREIYDTGDLEGDGYGRPTRICTVAIGDYVFEQLISDLEVICK